MDRGGYVYILTNPQRTVLYTGVTSNLLARLAQHKSGEGGGFTARYQAHMLVYCEGYPDIRQAIAEEKRIKAGSRKAKIQLIESQNPLWRDLSNELG